MEECIENSSEPTAEPWMRYRHWAQRAFVGDLRQADIIVCPTITEESLGRTAVEAIAVGRPIVASRFVWLMITVLDEVSGLLSELGGLVDLAKQLASLKHDRLLRQRMGDAGRMHFQNHFTWNLIIDKHDRNQFGPTIREHLERRQ